MEFQPPCSHISVCHVMKVFLKSLSFQSGICFSWFLSKSRLACQLSHMEEDSLMEVEDHLQLLVRGDRVSGVVGDGLVTGALADTR